MKNARDQSMSCLPNNYLSSHVQDSGTGLPVRLSVPKIVYILHSVEESNSPLLLIKQHCQTWVLPSQLVFSKSIVHQPVRKDPSCMYGTGILER
jgi:hypothetical protein